MDDAFDYLDTVFGEHGSVHEKDLQSTIFLSQLYDTAAETPEIPYERCRGASVFSPVIRQYIDDHDSVFSTKSFINGQNLPTRKYDMHLVDPRANPPKSLQNALDAAQEFEYGELMTDVISYLPSVRHADRGDQIDIEQARTEFQDILGDKRLEDIGTYWKHLDGTATPR